MAIMSRSRYLEHFSQIEKDLLTFPPVRNAQTSGAIMVLKQAEALFVTKPGAKVVNLTGQENTSTSTVVCAEVLTGSRRHMTSSATFISDAFKSVSYELRFTSPLDAIVLKRRGHCGFVQKENTFLKGSFCDWLPPTQAVTSSFFHPSCFLTLPLCSLHATLVSMRQISIKRAFVLAFFVVNYCAEGSGLALLL